MRIITGTLKGRRLNPPENLPVRPTTDMARESLFNILNNMTVYENISVLDLFSGTGAVSFEFISRGAKQVTAIEINNKCTDFIKKSADTFQIKNLHVVRADVFDIIKRAYQKFDIIFADPPYALDGLATLPDKVFAQDILHPGAYFILEHPQEFNFSNHPRFCKERKYGNVHFSFFEMPV